MASAPLSLTRAGKRRRALRRIGDDGHDIPTRTVPLGHSAEALGRPPSSVRKLVRFHAASRGTPIQPNTLSRACTKRVERAGVPRIRFHDLQQTGATLLLVSGNIRKWCGSASGMPRSARRSIATRIVLLICSSERRHGLMSCLTRRLGLSDTPISPMYLLTMTAAGSCGVLGNSGSDNPGLVALSGTCFIRCQAEKRGAWSL
jgi:hypothetical protein